jgi:hypothetical protein
MSIPEEEEEESAEFLAELDARFRRAAEAGGRTYSLEEAREAVWLAAAKKDKDAGGE